MTDLERTMLGEKAMTCLRLAALSPISDERLRGEAAAHEKYSEKAIDSMYRSLVHRGYMECGVSARTGWLTDKGREVLK